VTKAFSDFLRSLGFKSQQNENWSYLKIEVIFFNQNYETEVSIKISIKKIGQALDQFSYIIVRTETVEKLRTTQYWCKLLFG
jgi:acyl-CoA thioesterase FadM